MMMIGPDNRPAGVDTLPCLVNCYTDTPVKTASVASSAIDPRGLDNNNESHRKGGGITMATGKVKWFNNAKGYGFIRPDEGGEDLFVHYSYIRMDGFKSLKAGQPVEFEIQEAPKGYHAVNLLPLEQSAGHRTTDQADSSARAPGAE